MVANRLGDAEHLIGLHAKLFLGIWVIISAYEYVNWYRRIGDTDGWSFYAELDEAGVNTNAAAKNRIEWDSYVSYEEYEDYLQINDKRGGISFLPKTPDLFEAIEFTKRKIQKK